MDLQALTPIRAGALKQRPLFKAPVRNLTKFKPPARNATQFRPPTRNNALPGTITLANDSTVGLSIEVEHETPAADRDTGHESTDLDQLIRDIQVQTPPFSL